MSMGDKSYCATFCDQEDCERNVRFNKPTEKYYSMTTFDDTHENHKHCPWKIKKECKMNSKTPNLCKGEMI